MTFAIRSCTTWDSRPNSGWPYSGEHREASELRTLIY